MSKKLWIVLAVVAGLAIGLVGFALGSTAVAVYAQQPTQDQPQQGYGFGPGRMMGGRGMGMGFRSGADGEGPLHETIVAAFAEKTGLTVEQVEARHDNGETLWQIAQSQGMSQDDFTAFMTDARAKALDQAVTDGKITQEQADWMKSRWDQAAQNGFGPGNCPMMDGDEGTGNSFGRRGGRWQ